MIPQPLPTRKTARRSDIGWKVRKIRTQTRLRGPGFVRETRTSRVTALTRQMPGMA